MRALSCNSMQRQVYLLPRRRQRKGAVFLSSSILPLPKAEDRDLEVSPT